MPTSDADLLDAVRKLRTYVSILDNGHMLLSSLRTMSDQTVANMVSGAQTDFIATAKLLSDILKKIECTRQYRDMLKKFNLEEKDLNEL